MQEADLDAALEKVKQMPDGRYRGLASYFLKGEDVGEFVYTGIREDDPNDYIPHEFRRELRGLRVIASWINHTDVKDVNAMDVFAGRVIMPPASIFTNSATLVLPEEISFDIEDAQSPDRWGRRELSVLFLQAKPKGAAEWALPVAVFPGLQGDSEVISVLGWTHGVEVVPRGSKQQGREPAGQVARK